MTIGRGSLEPQQGSSTPTSGGDRLLLAMAALVLVAAAVMVIGNLLPDEAAVSEATPRPTPAPSGAATPTPTATPFMPRQVSLVSPEPSATAIPVSYRQNWMRASADLPIRSDPDEGAAVVGVMPGGSVALVEDVDYQGTAEPGWLHVAAPQPDGWVAVDPQDATVQLYPIESVEEPRSLWDISSGGQGFLAFGTDQGLASDSTWLATSATGVSWEHVEAGLSDTWIQGAAWGPAGWLTFVMPISGGWSAEPLELWQSPTGSDWSMLGVLPVSEEDLWPTYLVASDAGYLMESQGWSADYELWFSPNGRTWTEVEPPVAANGMDVRLVGTPLGFYVWTADEGRPGARAEAAFSTDGMIWWSQVNGGPSGLNSEVVAAGTGLVGMDNDPETGLARAWIGDAYQGQLTWNPIAIPALEGRSVAWLGGGGGRAVAFLWDAASDAVSGWESHDRRTWVQLNLPDNAFVVPPESGAVDAERLVVVGRRATLGRRHSVIWALDAAGWRAVDVESLPPPLAPSTECPAPPKDALDFLQVDAGFASYCFGDSSLTFRAWIVPCSDCTWDEDPGYSPPEPAWLAAPGENTILIAPAEVGEEQWYLINVTRAPDLAWDPAWEDSWVELTGHYNDPASSECHYVDRELDGWWESDQLLREDCARSFVVTDVTPLAAP